MAQRIAIDCDMHQARDEIVPGQPYDLAIRASGGTFRFLTIDLCEQCAKPLAEVFAEVAELGREFQGDVPTTAKTKRGPGRPANTGPNACPLCDQTYATRESLGTHLRTQHGTGLTEAFGRAPRASDKTCPVCGKTFTPQGLASHLRSHSSDAAHADG